ncbi:MAG: hypothetical protein HWN68_10285 [Desulfobacterales bacterium]|nr:hypothetical protein [Desulfobacterales bacterium]
MRIEMLKEGKIALKPYKVGEARELRDFLTGLLPASPVRKGGVEGSYSEMFVFLTGKPRAEARGGFTFGIVSMSNKTEE